MVSFKYQIHAKDVSNLENDIVIVCGYFRKLIRGVAGGW